MKESYAKELIKDILKDKRRIKKLKEKILRVL